MRSLVHIRAHCIAVTKLYISNSKGFKVWCQAFSTKKEQGADVLYEVFIADCKREMRLRRMKNKDLARATGFKTSTINSFFAEIEGRGKSERVAKAISSALNVKM